MLMQLAEAALACPPSKTWTTGPDEDADLVLAEGGLSALRVAGPFEVPWAVAQLPDGTFLVTERPGRLQHVRADASTSPVSGVPAVFYVGHGGLLDVAVDPEFEENRFVYLSYLQGNETASTIRVLRARFDEDNEALIQEQVIFQGSPGLRPEQIGGRIALTGDGYIFIALGDRWEGARAQDLSDTAGSIVRIKTDGTVPEDNPFILVEGARPEIWSYGHRNPQGLAFDRTTGELWSDEHGPQGGDELNRIVRGGNYGWPIATYGVDYSDRPIAVNSEQPGTELPVHYWVPLSIAPSSLAVETQPSTTEIWIGALAGEMVVQLTLANNCVVRKQRLLWHRLGRIRDVRIDPSGVLYVLTAGGEGVLYRVELPHGEMREGGKGPL
ncbi:MAG TPA: PQQ-dependent sugar dehydrogenase [Methyloceanibacter sp.]|jgi:glucose/arabinose dehydrogenase|nr:PQQ-dependent sugar dehydrogenase [Methyloceanibacter sp.]